MRKLVRISLRTVLFALLALSLAIVVLWVRSYSTRDAVAFQRGDIRWEICSDHGVLAVDDQPQIEFDMAQWDELWGNQADDLLAERRRLVARANSLLVAQLASRPDSAEAAEIKSQLDRNTKEYRRVS